VRYEFGVKVLIVTTLKEGLVVGARSMPGNDGHTLHEALEQAAILSEVKPEMAFVDRGYRGVEVERVRIWRSGQKRGVTRGLSGLLSLGLVAGKEDMYNDMYELIPLALSLIGLIRPFIERSGLEAQTDLRKRRRQ
jgi:hypothetical protein